MKKFDFLVVGDAMVTSGLGKVTEHVAKNLKKHGSVAIFGIGYHIPDEARRQNRYPDITVIPAMDSGDTFGYKKFPHFVRTYKPKHIVFIHDSWIVRRYVEALNEYAQLIFTNFNEPALHAYCPVDGDGYCESDITFFKDFQSVTVTTKWAQKMFEPLFSRANIGARLAQAYHGTEGFFAFDKKARQTVKEAMNIPANAIVWTNFNQHQPRKRLDRTLELFARSLRLSSKDSPLYLVLKTSDRCYHSNMSLAEVWKRILHIHDLPAAFEKRVLNILPMGDMYHAIDDETMNIFYNIADANINTATSEGFGLIAAESATVGCPQILSRNNTHIELHREGFYGDMAQFDSGGKTYEVNLYSGFYGVGFNTRQNFAYRMTRDYTVKPRTWESELRPLIENILK